MTSITAKDVLQPNFIWIIMLSSNSLSFFSWLLLSFSFFRWALLDTYGHSWRLCIVYQASPKTTALQHFQFFELKVFTFNPSGTMASTDLLARKRWWIEVLYFELFKKLVPLLRLFKIIVNSQVRTYFNNKLLMK